MSVAFGKIKTAAVGRTQLAKQIEKHGFRVDASLDTARIREVIRATCAQYPPKKKKWGGGFVADKDGPFRPLVIDTQLTRRVISYGIVRLKDGKERLSISQWGLVLTEADGGRRLKLTYAKLANGQIQAVQEMEEFLNALEKNLQLDDPDASITMEGDSG